MLGHAHVVADQLGTQHWKKCPAICWFTEQQQQQKKNKESFLQKGRWGRQQFAKQQVIHISDLVYWQCSVPQRKLVDSHFGKKARNAVHPWNTCKRWTLPLISLLRALREIFGSGNNMVKKWIISNKFQTCTVQRPGNSIELRPNPSC